MMLIWHQFVFLLLKNIVEKALICSHGMISMYDIVNFTVEKKQEKIRPCNDNPVIRTW